MHSDLPNHFVRRHRNQEHYLVFGQFQFLSDERNFFLDLGAHFQSMLVCWPTPVKVRNQPFISVVVNDEVGYALTVDKGQGGNVVITESAAEMIRSEYKKLTVLNTSEFSEHLSSSM